ncbi:MAG: hypothetical protein WAS07_04525 [Micropruina sp.]
MIVLVLIVAVGTRAIQLWSSGRLSSPGRVPYGVGLTMPISEPRLIGIGILCSRGTGVVEVTGVRWLRGADLAISRFTVVKLAVGDVTMGEVTGSLQSQGYLEQHSVVDVTCGSWVIGDPAFQLILEIPSSDEMTGVTGTDLEITYRVDGGPVGTWVEPFSLSLCGANNPDDPGC